MLPDHAGPVLLRDAQRALARALREEHATLEPPVFDGPPDIAVEHRLAVYRNNVRQFFRNALALTFPVLQRRVGEDFFRQLAAEYRAAHPSRSGDLHWTGARFSAWLRVRLRDTEYRWLADLAALEWACEEAAACAVEPPERLQGLACIPPEQLDNVCLRLQPSLRLVASPWPVWSVWQANQREDAAPVDLTTGPEHCACVGSPDAGVAVYRLDPDAYALLDEVRNGVSFAEALARSGTTAEVLARLLEWAYGEGLVVGVNPSARA